MLIRCVILMIGKKRPIIKYRFLRNVNPNDIIYFNRIIKIPSIIFVAKIIEVLPLSP